MKFEGFEICGGIGFKRQFKSYQYTQILEQWRVGDSEAKDDNGGGSIVLGLLGIAVHAAFLPCKVSRAPKCVLSANGGVRRDA